MKNNDSTFLKYYKKRLNDITEELMAEHTYMDRVRLRDSVPMYQKIIKEIDNENK